MSLKYRERLILAKLESTPGAAETLAAADAVLCGALDVTPLASDQVERDIVRPYLGARPQRHHRKHARIRLGVELAGSGDRDAAPAWGKFLRACYMTETVTADVDAVEDDPDTTGVDESQPAAPGKVVYSCAEPATPGSLTISCNIDGVRQTLTGCRGSWSLSIGAGGVPSIEFDLVGAYAAPADAALLSNPDYGAWQEPIVASFAGTPTATLFGVAVALQELSLDWGADVQWRDLIGATPGARLRDRQTTGNLTVDAAKTATLALVDNAATGATGALEIVHGLGDGKIVRVHAPKLQLGSPSYRDSDGIWQVSSDYRLLPTNGDDDLTIEVK